MLQHDEINVLVSRKPLSAHGRLEFLLEDPFLVKRVVECGPAIDEGTRLGFTRRATVRER